MSARCKIWWDDSVVQAYAIECAFNKSFIEAIKQLIPAGKRAFNPKTKVWTFDELFFDEVRDLAKAVWPKAGEVLIVTKAQTKSAAQQAATSNPNTVRSVISEADKALYDFARLLTPEALQAAYRKAALDLHPDRNAIDGSRMAMLNEVWSRVKKEVLKQ